LICAGGQFIAWELKVEGGVISDLQKYNINKVKLAGGVGRVVTPTTLDVSITELKGFL
jgi:hypothetical protein